MYFPNRLELLLRAVLALPNASSRGLSCGEVWRGERGGHPEKGKGRWREGGTGGGGVYGGKIEGKIREVTNLTTKTSANLGK